ncbi:MAG: glycosyltransferase family 4 protein [Candidatus Hydrogenedentes bacterium]|nr:glycosyltransferase family 4 protein [Candidatus Hydrogenedentota bacterium]
MKRFRVAHVITRLCKGGAQENTFHTVRLADRARYEVDLISGYTTGAEGSIEDRVRAAGIDVIREPMLVRAVSPVRDWLALRRLARVFRERRYDIVHTHTSKAGFVGRLAAVRAGVPLIVHTPHGHVFEGYFPKPVTQVFIRLERYAARKSHRLIALTARGIEQHLAQGVGRREQWIAIFSGIDLSPYAAAVERREATRRALGIEPGDLLVGGVGRLEPVKGFAYFVEAAHRIAEAVPRARFILAGDGSQAGFLREKAQALGDRFRLLGLRDDVPDLMAAMDIFVLPSVNEGMGRVLLECGAAGTPAVASAVGGVPDVLADGVAGLLVPPGDAGAIAGAVETLAADPERRRRMGSDARAAVVPAYGLERMVQSIEAVYETLIEEQGLDC